MKRFIPMFCILVIALAFSEQFLSIAQAANPPVKGAVAVNCLASYSRSVPLDLFHKPPGWRWTGQDRIVYVSFNSAIVGSDGRSLICKYGEGPGFAMLHHKF